MSYLKLVLLASLLGHAIAAPSQASLTLTKTTRTTLRCTTSYGTKSVPSPIPTTTKTETSYLLPIVGTSTSTPKATSTPPAVTSTSTTTAKTTVTTTATTITNTFSTTSTVTETTTDTNTATTTEFSTTTLSFTTSTTTTNTIATSNGFLPIKSTTATAYPNGPSRRHILERGQQGSQPRGPFKSQYPQKVSCTSSREIIITVIIVRTATTTQTTTLAPITSTATTTVTDTSTSTVVPADVSTTESFTETTTTNTITTTTVTQTQPVTTSTTTTLTSTTSYYAACATNNILGPNSQYGYLEGVKGSPSVEVTPQPNEYECCARCIASNKCASTLYPVGANNPAQGQCYELLSNTCSSQQSGYADGYLTKITDNGQTFISSNGNCGYLYYGGTYQGQ